MTHISTTTVRIDWNRMIDSLRHPMIIFDSQAQPIWANQAARESGWMSEQTEVCFLNDGKKQYCAQCPMVQAIDQQTDQSGTAQCPNGRNVHIHAIHEPAEHRTVTYWQPIQDQQQNTREQQTITQLQQRVEQARRSAEEMAMRLQSDEQSRTMFLANMSHELRTPLTSILGFAELLCDTQINAEQRQEYHQTINRNGEQMLGLINSILDTAKPESTEQAEQTCDPGQIAEAVVQAFTAQAETKSLKLTCTLPDTLPPTIPCNGTRLRQALTNMLDNAIKFTDTGSVSLTVRPSRAHQMLSFEIVDTGIGIPADQWESIFIPFRQVDGSMARRHGGAGLGLAITRTIAHQLGGDIGLQSTPGRGSRFTMTVPWPQYETSRTDTISPIRTQTPQALPKRILVAEDGPDNQRLLKYLLQKLQMQVTVVDDGRQACQAVAQAQTDHQPFDLVLMDMQMPVMDGYQATGQLRELYPQLPVVAVTAHALAGDRDRCMAVGCVDYLTKPLKTKQLYATIQRLLATADAGRPSSI